MFETLAQLTSNILVPTMTYGLIAAGFTVMYSVTKMLDLALGAVAIVAGYIFFTLTISYDLGVVTAAAIAVFGAVALELIIATFVYEPLRRRRVLSTAVSLIASLAILHIIENILLAVYGPLTKSFALLDIKVYSIAGASITSAEIAAVLIPAVLLGLLAFFLFSTKYGKAIRATSDHEEVAEIIGINVKRIRYLAYVIAGIAVGVAGVLFALQYNLEPGMTVFVPVRMFLRAVLGGIGSIAGALMGSFLTEVVLNITALYWITQAQEVLYFVLIFMVLLWRPQGILGKKQ